MKEGRYRVRLLRWSESSVGGRTVTFQLPEDADEHPFKGLATGKRAGTLLEVVIREVPTPSAPLETLTPPATTEAADPEAETKHTGRGPRARILRQRRSAVFAAPAVGVSERPPLRVPLRSGRGRQAVLLEDGGVPFCEARPPALVPRATVEAALDVPRAAIEIAEDRPRHGPSGGTDRGSAGEGRGPGGDGEGGAGQGEEEAKPGVVDRAITLCKEVDRQRAGFFYYMKARYPSVPELPAEAGQWSRDAHATRNRVCFHCETAALAELGANAKAELRFETLEADYERAERNR